MGIPLLFVTSFNKALYDATGRRLIKSFLRHKIPVHLLLTYEENAVIPTKQNPYILYYNLEEDSMLKNWLEKFKHVIPKAYNGTAPDCQCKIKTKIEKWNGHKQGCSHSEWNRRASKWFRKIVALNAAINLKADPEKIIFLDSDVYFTKHTPIKLFNMLFGANGLIYHLGQYRKKMGTCIESGVIGFSQKYGGYEYLKKVTEYYLSGEFINSPRWDDCYAFSTVLNRTSENQLKRRDLVVIERRTSHVVNLGSLRNYLVHDKGHHLKYYKIV